MEATATKPHGVPWETGFWSPRRFGQLLLRELVSGYRGLLIAMAAVGGALIVVSALTVLGMVLGGRTGARGGDYYLGFYQNLLLLGGFIVTSLAFREMWHNGGGTFYLTIPGSIFEKLTSKLLVTSLGYALGSTIFFTAAAVLSEGLNLLIFGVGHGFFNPLTMGVLRLIAIYLVAQSVFLLGSIWFRKLAFVRTVLWIAIFAAVAAVVAGVSFRLALGGHIQWNVAQTGELRMGGWSLDLSQGRLPEAFAPGTRAYGGLMVFRTIACVMRWLVAPVAWLASYFRLRESEV